jgi:hypothetical protein
MLSSLHKRTNMLILHKEDHGAVYTLGEENELFHAPIYTDNTVNLNEFIPVDMDSCDDEYEVLDIQNELIAASSNVRY